MRKYFGINYLFNTYMENNEEIKKIQDVPSHIYNKFIEELSGLDVSPEIINRLRDILIEKKADITVENLKEALLLEE